METKDKDKNFTPIEDMPDKHEIWSKIIKRTVIVAIILTFIGVILMFFYYESI